MNWFPRPDYRPANLWKYYLIAAGEKSSFLWNDVITKKLNTAIKKERLYSDSMQASFCWLALLWASKLWWWRNWSSTTVFANMANHVKRTLTKTVRNRTCLSKLDSITLRFHSMARYILTNSFHQGWSCDQRPNSDLLLHWGLPPEPPGLRRRQVIFIKDTEMLVPSFFTFSSWPWLFLQQGRQAACGEHSSG